MIHCQWCKAIVHIGYLLGIYKQEIYWLCTKCGKTLKPETIKKMKVFIRKKNAEEFIEEYKLKLEDKGIEE